MKRILALVLLVVALAVAVSGYQYAKVDNAAQGALVKTDNALLAVAPGDGPGNDGVVNISDIVQNKGGQLTIDFRKGHDGNYGVQDESEYFFQHTVKVTNNAEHPVNVSVVHDGGYWACGLDWITTDDCPTCQNWSHTLTDIYGKKSWGAPVRLGPGEDFSLNFWFTTKGMWWEGAKNCNFNVQLQSEVTQ